MGPYYLTTLIHVVGPVESVAAVGSKSRATRVVQTGDRVGTEFTVEVPTHGSAIAQYVDGGTGDVKITRAWALEAITAEAEWHTVPVQGVYAERGIGVLGLGRGRVTAALHSPPGELALHVLDTMVAIDEAVTERRTVPIASRTDRVPLVADDFDPLPPPCNAPTRSGLSPTSMLYRI